MTPQQISALQGVALSILALLVTFGLVNEDASKALVGVVAALFVALGAFFVRRPKDH